MDGDFQNTDPKKEKKKKAQVPKIQLLWLWNCKHVSQSIGKKASDTRAG